MTAVVERIALLPLRLGLRATRLAWQPVIGIAERLFGDGDGDNGPPPASAPAPAPVERPARPARPDIDEPYYAPEPLEPEPVESEPEHVEVEEELVAQSADPGAESAPGPDLRVAEPWEGYRRMKAAEIIARIESSPREELAVVQLYEGTSRRRKTVLEAAERRLRALSGPAARG